METEDNEVECLSLSKQIVKAKIQLAILNRKKRLLVEELHRQYLEGEIDPKKRTKFAAAKPKKVPVKA